jgi:hypothetical protein
MQDDDASPLVLWDGRCAYPERHHSDQPCFWFRWDLIAGQKPLVLQALAVWRREDRLLGVSRNGLQRRVSAVRNILFSDIFSSWKSATPGGFPSRVIPLRSRQCAGKTA